MQWVLNMSHRTDLINTTDTFRMQPFWANEICNVKPCWVHTYIYSCVVTVYVTSKFQLISTNPSNDNQENTSSITVPPVGLLLHGPVLTARQSLGHHIWAAEQRIQAACQPWLVNLIWAEWHCLRYLYPGWGIQTHIVYVLSVCELLIEHCPRVCVSAVAQTRQTVVWIAGREQGAGEREATEVYVSKNKSEQLIFKHICLCLCWPLRVSDKGEQVSQACLSISVSFKQWDLVWYRYATCLSLLLTDILTLLSVLQVLHRSSSWTFT